MQLRIAVRRPRRGAMYPACALRINEARARLALRFHKDDDANPLLLDMRITLCVSGARA
jgi:hypothetical protein